MTKRTLTKWLHWIAGFLILYFFLVEPENVDNLGAAGLATHAGFGVILGIITGIWIVSVLRNGLLTRAGPKLPQWAKRIHSPAHKATFWLVVFMVATGAATGFAAPYIIHAFGILPINFGGGTKAIHGVLEEVHEITFNVLTVTIIGHALYHIWRHYLVKDNALRIIMPKALHRFL